MEHEGGGYASYNWCALNNLKMIGKDTEKLGNMRTSRHYLDDSIIKIGQKNPEDSLKLAVTYTPVRNNLLTLEGKTLLSKIII